MSEVWLVTGGARSGKSAFAEGLAKGGASRDWIPGQARNDEGEGLARGFAPPARVVYVATAVAEGEEMAERIARHRADRPQEWATVERYRGFAEVFGRGFVDSVSGHGMTGRGGDDGPGVVLVDCLANLLMGILYEELGEREDFLSSEFERVEELAIAEVDTIIGYAREGGKRLIIVTNEIGLGIVPATRYSRYYRDALGRLNKHAAAAADRVVFMVSGIPMAVKGGAL